ncbi:MAG: glutamate racemase [Thermodesulfobacteriota bacterium]|nr:glutamate racemase [Thermodesulfobacteriota bacterium]
MIGIFDSGLGGLTVARAIMDELPGYDITYFGDTARTPYGAKSPQTVIQYALEDSAFLIDQGAKIIVIACNSASSVATEAIMERFDIPVFEVITPAVAMAVEITRKGVIGVIGTRATINSGIYEKKIRERAADATIHSRACPLLVPLVEEGWMNKPETRMIVKKYLHPLKTRQIDTLILGCTHYPILKPIIQAKAGKRVGMIDSAMAVARAIRHFIETDGAAENRLTTGHSRRFFVSDITPQFEKTAGLILNRKITLDHVSV